MKRMKTEEVLLEIRDYCFRQIEDRSPLFHGPEPPAWMYSEFQEGFRRAMNQAADYAMEVLDR